MAMKKSSSHICREFETHILLECEPDIPLLIVCDHASARIPDDLNNLGVEEGSLKKHIAWDIGAGKLARSLGEIFSVPVVLASTSRLVVDCNRNLDDPSAFPLRSDGSLVPGNESLRAEDRERRANAYYWPYHHAVRDQLRELEHLAAAPAVIAVHSFTPELEGFKRPWHIGALWDKDPRLAVPFMQVLSGREGVVVGDNEPYSGRHPADFTLDHHAEAEGLAHLGIEVRQDLIETDVGVDHWANVIADGLREVLHDKTIYTHRAGGN